MYLAERINAGERPEEASIPASLLPQLTCRSKAFPIWERISPSHDAQEERGRERETGERREDREGWAPLASSRQVFAGISACPPPSAREKRGKPTLTTARDICFEVSLALRRNAHGAEEPCIVT